MLALSLRARSPLAQSARQLSSSPRVALAASSRSSAPSLADAEAERVNVWKGTSTSGGQSLV